MSKIFPLAFVLFSFVSYTKQNELNVSISEELKYETIVRYSKIDSNFNTLYKQLRFGMDSLFKNSTKYDYYKNLKYSQFYDFQIEYNTLLKNEWDLNKSHWNNKFKNTLDQFFKDSVYWDNYIRQNDFNSYVELEILEFNKTKDNFGLDKCYGILKIIPKKDVQLQKIKGFVFIKEKESLENNKIPNAYFSYSGKSNNPTITYINNLGSASDMCDFTGIPIETILQKYDITFIVNDLIINNRFIDVEFEKCDSFLREYILNKNDIYKSIYIINNIDSTFLYFEPFHREITYKKFENKFEKEMLFFKDFWEDFNLKNK